MVSIHFRSSFFETKFLKSGVRVAINLRKLAYKHHVFHVMAMHVHIEKLNLNPLNKGVGCIIHEQFLYNKS